MRFLPNVTTEFFFILLNLPTVFVDCSLKRHLKGNPLKRQRRIEISIVKKKSEVIGELYYLDGWHFSLSVSLSLAIRRCSSIDTRSR